MTRESPEKLKLYLRNFVFGAEDSLVSTVGLLSGIAIAGMPKSTILVAGIVLIFVEAFSMGAGSFISEHSAEEYIKGKHGKNNKTNFIGATIMLVTYFIAGFIPLAPYLLFSVNLAFPISIMSSLLALGLLGAINAKIFKITILRHALEMIVVGGLAILVGVGVGQLLGFIK